VISDDAAREAHAYVRVRQKRVLFQIEDEKTAFDLYKECFEKVYPWFVDLHTESYEKAKKTRKG
jgi:methyl coenzyme M reductase subunit D